MSLPIIWKELDKKSVAYVLKQVRFPVTDSLDLSDYIFDQHDGLKEHLLVTGKIMAQLFQEAGEWEVTRLHFFMG